MTPLPSAEPTTRSWSPQPGLVGTAWGLAAVALLIGVLSGENTTKLLMGVGTAFLLFLAVHGTFVRPRLSVDEAGLSVRTLSSTHQFPWHEVKVRLATTRRLGRESETLELDWERGEDEHLAVLTRMDLGADPREVAEVLHALRP